MAGISAGISASTSFSGAGQAAATVISIPASTAASAAAVDVQPPLAELVGEKGAPMAAGGVWGITLAAAERDWHDANRLGAPSRARWAPIGLGPEGDPEGPVDVSNGGGGGDGGGGGGHVVGSGATVTRSAS